MPEQESHVQQPTMLIIVDALRDDEAARNFGFMESLVAAGEASRMGMTCVLPSMSRPCYEAIVTGTYPLENGVLTNDIVRKSKMQSLFDVVCAAGGRSAAIGFYFFSELYCEAPFDVSRHCEWEDADGPVHWGRFFVDEGMPNSHLLHVANRIMQQHKPEFILVHLNHTDVVGHRFGGSSREYRSSLIEIDSIIATYFNTWSQTYSIFVTGDHGTSSEGLHGGTEDEVRSVPFYALQRDGQLDAGPLTSQTHIARRICEEMGIEAAPTMHGNGNDHDARMRANEGVTVE